MTNAEYESILAHLRHSLEILRKDLPEYVSHDELLNDKGYLLMIAITAYLEYK